MTRIGCAVVLCWIGLASGQQFPSESRLPTIEEAKKILQAVCPKASHVTPGKQWDAVCDTFAHAQGAGKTASITTVIAGRFSQAAVSELVVDFGGQEAHVYDFGGSVLLREVNGAWQFVRYEAGFRSTSCSKFPRKDGTSLLLCRGGHSAMGENSVYLFSYDWSRTRDPETILLKVVDTRLECRPTFTAARLSRFEVRDFNGDGLPDLGVTAEAGRGRTLKQHTCGKQPVPSMQTFEIQFLFDGKGFRVSPATAATKKKLDVIAGGER